MRFSSKVTSAKEALFVGHEPRYAYELHGDEWNDSGRWRISLSALDRYLDTRLLEQRFGSSIDGFVFCFEIADFEKWGEVFKKSAGYTSYRPKRREVWSVGQLRWSNVKDLPIDDQLQALSLAIEQAVLRVETMHRKPKDFAYAAFAAAVTTLLHVAPVDELRATPRSDSILGR